MTFPWVKCVQAYEPRSSGDDQNLLGCREGDFIKLVKAGREQADGNANFFLAQSANGKEAQSLNKLIIVSILFYSI